MVGLLRLPGTSQRPLSTRALAILRANRFPETHPDVKLYRDNLARVEALLAALQVT